jgi:hypothetical protein
MGKSNYKSSDQNPPEIFTVTDLPNFFKWGNEKRLINILENYIGLPVAYHGVQIRKDFITALPGVMRYKNPTPNPLPASEEGAKMYLIRAETAVIKVNLVQCYGIGIRKIAEL